MAKDLENKLETDTNNNLRQSSSLYLHIPRINIPKPCKPHSRSFSNINSTKQEEELRCTTPKYSDYDDETDDDDDDNDHTMSSTPGARWYMSFPDDNNNNKNINNRLKYVDENQEESLIHFNFHHENLQQQKTDIFTGSQSNIYRGHGGMLHSEGTFHVSRCKKKENDDNTLLNDGGMITMMGGANFDDNNGLKLNEMTNTNIPHPGWKSKIYSEGNLKSNNFDNDQQHHNEGDIHTALTQEIDLNFNLKHDHDIDIHDGLRVNGPITLMGECHDWNDDDTETDDAMNEEEEDEEDDDMNINITLMGDQTNLSQQIIKFNSHYGHKQNPEKDLEDLNKNIGITLMGHTDDLNENEEDDEEDEDIDLQLNIPRKGIVMMNTNGNNDEPILFTDI